MKNIEKTYVMLKPDAVERGLMGEIIKRIEQKGLKIVEAKLIQLNKEILNEHYAHVLHLDFYPNMEKFMLSGKVLAMIVEGNSAISTIRKMIGATNYLQSLPGTIRGDFAETTAMNLIHASDSAETAEIEIKRFFG